MSRMRSRTIAGMSAYASVVTSPAMCTWPVVIMVSTATRLRGSSLSKASRTESLMASAILSGWPSVTDSEVKRRRDTLLLGREGNRHARWSKTGAVIKPVYRTPLLASRAIGQPGDDEIPHHVGEGLLRAVGYGRLATVRAQDHRRVVGHLETAAVPDLVDDQQITALASQLGPAVRQHATTVVPGLGGKAHDDLAGSHPVSAELGEDVGVAHQGQRWWLRGVGLLDLDHRPHGRGEVGHRRGHHDRVRAGRGSEHGRPQFRGGDDRYDGDAGRKRYGEVGRHQRHLGAAGGCALGQRHTLAAGRAVAEEAHRVQVLAGAAGTDHDVAAGKVGT